MLRLAFNVRLYFKEQTNTLLLICKQNIIFYDKIYKKNYIIKYNSKFKMVDQCSDKQIWKW
jgi:hypothetical protein